MKRECKESAESEVSQTDYLFGHLFFISAITSGSNYYKLLTGKMQTKLNLNRLHSYYPFQGKSQFTRSGTENRSGCFNVFHYHFSNILR